MNYYDVLGVSPTASTEEIRENYLNLIKAFHPDSYSGPKDFAKKKSAELNEAYEVLKDEEKRAVYDSALLRYSENVDLDDDIEESSEDDEEKEFHYNRAYEGAMKNFDTEKKLKAAKKKGRKRFFTILLLIAIIIGEAVICFKIVDEKNNDVNTAQQEVKALNPYKYASNWYLDRAVLIKTTDSEYYHRYGCEKLGSQPDYEIVDVNQALRDGYTKCPECFDEDKDEYILKNFTTGGAE